MELLALEVRGSNFEQRDRSQSAQWTRAPHNDTRRCHGAGSCVTTSSLGATVTTAESCTGGMVAAAITDVAPSAAAAAVAARRD